MEKFYKMAYLIFFLTNYLVVKGNVEKVVQEKNIDSLLSRASNPDNGRDLQLQYADTAFEILKSKPFYSNFTNNCVQVANIFYIYNKSKKHLSVIDFLIKKSEIENDNEAASWGTHLKGNYYYSKTEYDSAYYYYSKTEKTSVLLSYKSLLGSNYLAQAGILILKNDYVNAEIKAINALKIGKTEKDNIIIYNSYLILGNALLGLKEYHQSIFYYVKSIEISKELINLAQYPLIAAQPYNYIAGAYIKQGNYKNALNYANEGLKFKKLKVNGIEVYCYLRKDLSYAKFKLNQLSSDAEFQEILKIADSINSIPVQLFTKMHLAEYHLVNKNVPKALRYGAEARKLAHKAQFFEEELKILQLLSEIDASKSLIYTKRYIALNDSLLDVERASRNKFARIEFETEEITAAKDNAEEQNTFLENRIWMISILSFLTVFIIGLWFINKSQKSKTRQLLLEQKQQQADEEIYQLMLNQQEKIEEGKSIEKQRISLELHDNVMGKMAAIRMNLYPLIMTSELENKDLFYKQLDDMQQVEKEIRGVAHDLNTNLFADEVSFIAVVKEFFEKVKNYTTINFELQIGETIDWELISITTKINLYRILQEALQNIEKYADAKNVAVTMSQIDNLVYILIEDDGKGFDTASKKEGIGLQNMKTRMDEMHGKFSIQSAPEKGTKISLIIAI